MLSGHPLKTCNPVTIPRKHAAVGRETCFRGQEGDEFRWRDREDELSLRLQKAAATLTPVSWRFRSWR